MIVGAGQLKVLINGIENHEIEHIEFSRKTSAPEYVLGGRGHHRLFAHHRTAEIILTLTAPVGAKIPEEIEMLEILYEGIGTTLCQLSLTERWPTLRGKEEYKFIGFYPNERTFAPKNNAQALHKLNKGDI